MCWLRIFSVRYYFYGQSYKACQETAYILLGNTLNTFKHKLKKIIFKITARFNQLLSIQEFGIRSAIPKETSPTTDKRLYDYNIKLISISYDYILLNRHAPALNFDKLYNITKVKYYICNLMTQKLTYKYFGYQIKL